MNKIIVDIARHSIDDITVDYEIHFDITGKIHFCNPLIFALPPSGQRLILGKREEERKNKIKAFGKLLELILPLGLQNQDSFFSSELNKIYSRVNTILKLKGLELKDLMQFCEENSLEYYIHSSYANKEQYPTDFQKIWDSTKDLIINRNTNIKTDSLRFLGYYYPQFGFKIIPLVIPFIKQPNTKRIAYENLEYYIAKESLTYLRNELRTCKDGQALSGIYKALSKHELKNHEAIQMDLINSYNSVVDLSEDSKANIMEALKHYPNQSSVEIGLKILKENKRHSSGRAARILLDQGYPAKNIAGILIPKLIASNPRESEAAFYILCNSKEFKPYIPNSNELLKIYVNNIKVNQNLNITYAMPSIMKGNYDSSTPQTILSYLNHENQNVQEGILILISCLLYEIDFPYKEFLSNKSISKYTLLISSKSNKVAEYSVRILGKIGRNEADNSYISKLNSIINFESNSLVNLYAMRAINEILKNADYLPIIENNYLDALKISNYNYRVAALEGFRHSNNDTLKKSIAYFVDDPSKDVQQAAKNLYIPFRKSRGGNTYQQLLYSEIRPYNLSSNSFVTRLIRFLSYYYYYYFRFNSKIPNKDELMMSVLKSQLDMYKKKKNVNQNKELFELKN